MLKIQQKLLRFFIWPALCFFSLANAQVRPLSDYDKKQIKQNISLSAHWQDLVELERMALMFPDNLTYKTQIDAILELYRHTLWGLEVRKEEAQWELQLSEQKLKKQLGHDVPPTQKDIAAAQARQLNGKPPELTRREVLQKHIDDLLQEAYTLNHIATEADYYKTEKYLQDVPNYTHAVDVISEMLDGKKPISIKDAYYNAEAAHGNLHLSYEEYTSLVQSNADFIRQWLTQNKFSLKNPEALHYGIQKFISDTLYITVQGKRKGHMPYYYDYIDFSAKNDRRNYFVTKTLATGTGQCHTFPVTYLILAEQLGVEAHMAYNPRHCFIQYKNNDGTTTNYETTVDRFMTDAFYLQTLPVMAKAQKNDIYIQSLNKKQLLASVLYDLAASFIDEHWMGDKHLILRCMKTAKTHFPDNQYLNVTECWLNKRLYASTLNDMVKAKNISNVSELEKYPEIVKAYDEYVAYIEKIDALGVPEYPEEEELRFAEYADKKGRLQQAKGINSKQKRTLFIQ